MRQVGWWICKYVPARFWRVYRLGGYLIDRPTKFERIGE